MIKLIVKEPNMAVEIEVASLDTLGDVKYHLDQVIEAVRKDVAKTEKTQAIIDKEL